ncbi:RNA-dependent RNA polymerase 2 [Rhododendron vialii]|uniref:RNA-dependent RNA polymerase 2 n=1 Tax=Rhododendron vialii TaxID=182163 RepID=UPI00265F6907|nr:RNA-dependent RNA polymerase 2 [Rhododendron vialii]
MTVERLTLRVSNIPQTATAKDLADFLDSVIATKPSSVYACEINTDRKNWKSRGSGRVQFDTLAAKSAAEALARAGRLVFKGSHLSVSPSFDDIVVRPTEAPNRAGRGVLHVGFLVKDDCLCVVESLEGFKAWVMPERKGIEFWVVGGGDKEWYKLELQYDYVLESCGCRLGGGEETNAVLLKLKHAPKIYKKMAGPNVTSKVIGNRYYFCKEDFEFIWVRTTDFSMMKSIGQSSSLCWEMKEESPALNIFTSLPYYKKDPKDLILEEGEEFGSTSELVPLVKWQSDAFLPYEILYQLNSLVHTHKISLGSVDDDLIEILGSLDVQTAMMILQKLHKLHSTCYEPLSFIKTRLHILNAKKLPSSLKITNQKLMRCHRVLVTPSKIYCLGPELETSNYVVKKFSAYASDFVRVTFVEEDWSKLPPNALSASLQQGIFAKPYRTNIYHRILSVLNEGIVIGAKRFEFLAFSASQLRSNAVWMFASNENVSAGDIREWMGCFNKIRSVSKCAARMGQLFSSSMQTLEVPSQEVEVIPDVEVTTDGIGYCFSDGIGKISLSFATQVAQKCGLNHTPSAFQIRYGGYKGVIAVDRNSFRKISLRGSMLKFESENRMLNVTKWSDSMPCYLNREIVTLLSSLGVDDKVFEAMQDQQLSRLEKMLTSREVALGVLESMSGSDAKGILAQMLLQGYEPNVEPYLSMMLRAHHNSLLSDLRSRCRIFVPKGRILIGCIDETGILEYGQVYCRTTMTKTELLQLDGQSFFQKVDETTSVVIGKVVVTKNPCLHPGDVRVLEAVYEVALEEKGLVDCVVFPQKGERPHPNECSGGDLDGDLYFISWDENLIPPNIVAPMDYTGRRPRIMDHEVTLQEIQKFFVDYMISDNLGAISTAHLIHADRDPAKALSPICLQLATLHSMAVDFAKTGAPAEMPRFLKPKEFPDFMERTEKPSYISKGVLGKLYRGTKNSKVNEKTDLVLSDEISQDAYDHDLILDGFEDFIEVAKGHKEMYMDKMSTLMNFYGAESEDEILTGNLLKRSTYLQRDNRRYYEMKDRIMVSVKSLHKEAKGWFESSCKGSAEQQKLASAWYHITYHPTFCQESSYCLGFPWVVGDILLNVKSVKSRK